MFVLITGGAGFIGAHVAQALARVGHYPIAYDNLLTGHRKFVRWGPLIVGNLADTKRLNSVFQVFPIDAVVHLAGSAYVGESLQKPGEYFRNNICALIELLDVMSANNVSMLVASSSCSTYGVTPDGPVNEAHQLNPLSPYAASKQMLERIVHSCAASRPLRATILRFFNVAGADPNGEIGELHTPETHLIPLAILASLRKSSPLEIFGNDYPTADGTAIRDYVHVCDVANAHVCALEQLIKGRAGTYNIGSGHGHSVLEVLEEVKRQTSRSVPMRLRPRRGGDSACLIADIVRAREELGWCPGGSDLETIVSTALRWFKSV